MVKEYVKKLESFVFRSLDHQVSFSHANVHVGTRMHTHTHTYKVDLEFNGIVLQGSTMG